VRVDNVEHLAHPVKDSCPRLSEGTSSWGDLLNEFGDQGLALERASDGSTSRLDALLTVAIATEDILDEPHGRLSARAQNGNLPACPCMWRNHVGGEHVQVRGEAKRSGTARSSQCGE
jgi:hypothetical protein